MKMISIKIYENGVEIGAFYLERKLAKHFTEGGEIKMVMGEHNYDGKNVGMFLAAKNEE